MTPSVLKILSWETKQMPNEKSNQPGTENISSRFAEYNNLHPNDFLSENEFKSKFTDSWPCGSLTPTEYQILVRDGLAFSRYPLCEKCGFEETACCCSAYDLEGNEL